MSKAIVNPQLLSKELKKFSSVVGRNTVLPILEYIKLEFAKNKLSVTGTDLETTLIVSLDCECSKPFTIVVEFSTLSSLVNQLAVPVTVDEKEKNVSIYSEEGRFSIPKEPKIETFPAVPDEEFIFSFDADSTFFNALYCADKCKNPTDYRFETACIDFKKDSLVVVGTDAYALYKETVKIKTGQTHKTLPPTKFVHSTKEFTEASVSIGEKFIKATQGNITVISRLKDGKYVDYNVIFPQTINYNFETNKADLITAVSRILSTASKMTNQIMFSFSNGVKLSSQDIDYSKDGEVEIKAVHSVDFDAIGMNGSQLIRLIETLSSENIKIAFTSPTRSIFIRDAENDDIIMLLQPLTINI